MNLKKKIDLIDFFSSTLIKYGKNLRKPQLELSLDIEESYSNSKIFVAEAEVGTGKTYAYLIPALNKIHSSRKPFLISTGTIVLQEQLSLKDIPDINKYLITEGFISTDIISCIGKGKEHYICEKRLIECDINEEHLDDIKNYYECKNIFDRSQINIKFSENLWKKINVKHCNRQRCQYRECLYRKMKIDQENYNYDFLICNHQYFLARIKDGKKEFISRFSGIVIDEAHNFEQAAFSILGGNKSIDDFINCIEHISYKLSKDYGHRNYNDNIENAYNEADLLFSKIKNNTYIPDKIIESTGQYNVKLDGEIQDVAEELYESMEFLSEKISILASFNSRNEKNEDGLFNEIKGLSEFLENISFTSNDNVWWSQLDSKIPRLFYVSKNIDEILYNILFNRGLPIILTSGTMSSEIIVEGSESLAFQYFTNNIGVDLIPYSKLKPPISKKSGFNYNEHGLLYIEEEIKFVKREDETNYRRYLDKLSERIYNIIELSKGRTLVLFTSKDAMDYTYNIVARMVKNNIGIKCLKQGQSAKIKHEFEEEINSSLFATGTYWEGIDVKGESLSTLIIHKLPFPVSNPVFEFKTERFGDSILIPEMIVKLKQGAGRLIRDEKDKGVLVILDSRANDKKYRNIINESLPPLKKIYDLDAIPEFIGTNQNNNTTLEDNSVQVV